MTSTHILLWHPTLMHGAGKPFPVATCRGLLSLCTPKSQTSSPPQLNRSQPSSGLLCASKHHPLLPPPPPFAPPSPLHPCALDAEPDGTLHSASPPPILSLAPVHLQRVSISERLASVSIQRGPVKGLALTRLQLHAECSRSRLRSGDATPAARDGGMVR